MRPRTSSHGKDDLYGVPVPAMARWMVLAQEYDLMCMPVVYEGMGGEPRLAYLDLIRIDPPYWSAYRVSRQYVDTVPEDDIEVVIVRAVDQCQQQIERDKAGRQPYFTIDEAISVDQHLMDRYNEIVKDPDIQKLIKSFGFGIKE